MGNLEERLQKARAEKDLAEQLKRKLKSARESLEQAKVRARELEKTLKKEKRDVEKLEGLSLTGLFASLLGTKAERMDKERQEYLAAELKYETALDTVKALEKEINSLEEQLLPVAKAGDKYEAILREKEEMLKAQGGSIAETLLALAEEEGRLIAQGRELQEAQEAARESLKALDDLRDSLMSAANWGTLDMLGGGMLSTALKHSNVNDAKKQALRAQRYLERLNRELADVEIKTHLKIDIDGLTTFADYFFDGLIVDWIVQSRINEARNRVNSLRIKVESIDRSLRAELQKNAGRIGEIRKERTFLVDQG